MTPVEVGDKNKWKLWELGSGEWKATLWVAQTAQAAELASILNDFMVEKKLEF